MSNKIFGGDIPYQTTTDYDEPEEDLMDNYGIYFTSLKGFLKSLNDDVNIEIDDHISIIFNTILGRDLYDDWLSNIDISQQHKNGILKLFTIISNLNENDDDYNMSQYMMHKIAYDENDILDEKKIVSKYKCFVVEDNTTPDNIEKFRTIAIARVESEEDGRFDTIGIDENEVIQKWKFINILVFVTNLYDEDVEMNEKLIDGLITSLGKGKNVLVALDYGRNIDEELYLQLSSFGFEKIDDLSAELDELYLIRGDITGGRRKMRKRRSSKRKSSKKKSSKKVNYRKRTSKRNIKMRR
jgi:hypothetical protein